MQPFGMQVTYTAEAGCSLSSVTRVPWGICMPSGSVMRRSFFSSPCCSISAAPARNWPVSSRTSVTVRQTCFTAGAPAGCLGQILVQGECTTGGCCGCCTACCCGCCCCCCGCCCTGCFCFSCFFGALIVAFGGAAGGAGGF